ncbi:MAG: phosphatidate cytidylyltransferase, partial [bacterium]
NKSTAGFLGGLVAVVLTFILSAYLGIFPWSRALVFALGLGVAGPAGDLLISAFKRNRKLDDTGAILPGHGGLLDRIDSLLANTVVFYLLLNISGYLS